jgi:hypothetical protein
MQVLDSVVREGIRNILRQSVVEVTFTKSDGTERVMKCTLDEQHLPVKESSEEPAKDRKVNPDVCSVWDVEKKAWRSFRWDSIIKIGI